MALSDRIYLVGMPGAGKSTIGRMLAERLSTKFIDLDSEIEKNERCSIQEIFESKGEEYFRIVESELLHSLTHNHFKFIMATGGGTPCYHNGMDFILDNGSAIYLNVNPQVLVKRLSEVEEKSVRPKINPSANLKMQMENFFKERHSIYSCSNFVIDVGVKKSNQLLREILSI